ncbi:MAG: hypothetical protein ACXABY_08620, partial [Candidatus Thorarchaeota archaeon]
MTNKISTVPAHQSVAFPSKEMEKTLSTRLVRGKDIRGKFEKLRKMRIEEAMGWESGPSSDEPEKHVVKVLQEEQEVFFLKPGKDTRGGRVPFDMTPRVGDSYVNTKFDFIWKNLSYASLVDFDAFKAVLVLIYRSAFYLDHRETGGVV